MIVITNKAETRLLRDLQKAAKEAPTQKCFYLGFSNTDIERTYLQRVFLGLLEELPNSYMANVYICADKDIFILMQGFMQRHFTDFVQSLADALQVKDFANIIDAFELGVHWKQLESLCTGKIKAIDKAVEKAQEAERAKRANDMAIRIFSSLDFSMISTLNTRRQQHEKPVILVVDDDQISRALVNQALKKDFKMSFAKNGEQALEKYLVSAPDVCFLDIGLPDIGGHELLEAFSHIDPNHYTIMFSGRKDKDNMLRALRGGAQGFVGKPFSRDKLVHYISKSPFIDDVTVGGNLSKEVVL